MTTAPILAVLFDKDGTLFDFAETWNGWAAQLIVDLSGGDAALAERLAAAVRFDLAARAFHPDSAVIAGTNETAAAALCDVLTGADPAALALELGRRAHGVDLCEAVPLTPLLGGLRARDLALGVMTNDDEGPARAHLRAAQVLDMFDMVIGADSGFGAKPDPAPLLAFCDRVGVDPQATLMVGDSTHDLIAGRRAGMRTAGVLTGPARADALQPHADVVLPDIGHIPSWLDRRAPL